MNLAWEILFGVGSLALFAALIYGTIQYKIRNRANDRVTEQAVRAEYNCPAAYPRKREELQNKLRPS